MNPHQQSILTRLRLAAGIWLLLPGLTLLGLGAVPALAGWFRVRPLNLSYDAMFVAATAGVGLAAALEARALRQLPATAPLPRQFAWLNAAAAFGLLASLGLGVLNWAAGAPGAGAAWLLAFGALLAATRRVRRQERATPVAWAAPPPRSRGALRWAAAGLLTVLALGFLVGPVLLPWNGPPEPFVRWHPFSVPGELVWRGFFLSFALSMALAARDPLDRHRSLLRLLVCSGTLHAVEMALDNRLAFHRGHPNGNHEHLYGDVLGWALIAALSAGLLALSRRRPAAPTETAPAASPRPAAR